MYNFNLNVITSYEHGHYTKETHRILLYKSKTLISVGAWVIVRFNATYDVLSAY